MNLPLVVGVTGASGAPYAKRFIERATEFGVPVHLVVSDLGRRLLAEELDLKRLDPDELSGGRGSMLTLHNDRDTGAPPGSGSFRHRGMAIVPCSGNTLGRIAALDGFQTGRPAAYRVDHYLHQIPGGMISNLRYQLQQAGIGDRLPEVLEEVVRVREDLGHPIMVTPLSQFVGAQALVNVIAGARYAVIADSTIEYALGRHGGDEAVSLMDPDVRDRVLASPRAGEVARRLADPLPGLDELRTRFGRTTPDEDLIMLAIMGEDALDEVGPFRAVDLDRPPAPDVLATVRRSLDQALERDVRSAASGMRLAVTMPRDRRDEGGPS